VNYRATKFSAKDSMPCSRQTDPKLHSEQKYQEAGPIRSIPQGYGTSLAELLGNDQP